MKNAIIYRALKVVIWLFSRLPFSVLQKLGWAFSYIAPARKTKAVISANLKQCFPNLDEKKHHELVTLSFRHFMITALEMVSVLGRSPHYLIKQVVEVEGLEEYQKVLDQEQGVMMLGAHIGCWEIAAMYLAQTTDVAMLYTPAKKPYIDRLVHDARNKLCKKMSPANAKGLKMIFQMIKNKQVVALLTDQVPVGAAHNYMDFFQRPVRSMTLPDSVYKRFKPAVFYMYAARRHNLDGLKLYIQRIDHLIEQEPERETAVMKVCGDMLEAVIHKDPEQYQWSYKRFKYPYDGVDIYRHIYIKRKERV